MFTETPHKVRPEHLRRDAFLYVRQSTLRQVFENTESSKRQYALRERAAALGWPLERIHTIDTDLGISGAHAENRDGFQHLISEVALGRAGIVLGLEVSRLARNNADWHRLLELAALTQTLILDEDGVYDPAHFNDRLLLGLKGTMSEAELHVLRARLLGGQRSKARRGELAMGLPIGLVYDSLGAVILDPDQQIQQALRLVFDSFRESRSASAVVRRFNREHLRFPRRIRYGIGHGEVLWGPLQQGRVSQLLHNPRYAGAYVYGRTRQMRGADLSSRRTLKVARNDWPVLIKDAHPGYIDWEEFERNLATLRANTDSFGTGSRGRMPREGNALLQGRVVCGRCGHRMRVRYQKVTTTLAPYYICSEEAVRRAGTLCQSIRGIDVDAAVAGLLLQSLAPATIEIAIAVQDEIAGRIEQADQLRRSQLERARYEAELARRRYLKVDPDNRLVADTLEADWNERLRRLDALQQEHDRQRQADQALLSEQARAKIRTLAADFPRVWSDPHTAASDRKRMVALLIEDITLLKGEHITIHVRFRGGQTATISAARSKPMALMRQTPAQTIALLAGLVDTCSDKATTAQLNTLGHRNWKGEPYTLRRVSRLRRAYGLKSRYDRLREAGYLNAPEMSRHLGISLWQVYDLARAGILPRERYGSEYRCLFAPLDRAQIANAIARRYRRQRSRTVPARSSPQETV
jgi:DNA invertase Pin-like site-specific DNA recombinase